MCSLQSLYQYIGNLLPTQPLPIYWERVAYKASNNILETCYLQSLYRYIGNLLPTKPLPIYWEHVAYKASISILETCYNIILYRLDYEVNGG